MPAGAQPPAAVPVVRFPASSGPSPLRLELTTPAAPLRVAGSVALLVLALGLLLVGGPARLLTPVLVLAAGAWAVFGRPRAVRLDPHGVELRRLLLSPRRLGWGELVAVSAQGREPSALVLVFSGGRVRVGEPPGGFGPVLDVLSGDPLEAAVRHALDVRERKHEVRFGRLGLRTRELTHRDGDKGLKLEDLGQARVVRSPEGARLQVAWKDGVTFVDEPLEDVKNFPVLVRLLARERRQPLLPGWWVEAPASSPRRRFNRAGVLGGILECILGGIGFVVLCTLLIHAVEKLGDGIASPGWPRAPARILKSEVVLRQPASRQKSRPEPYTELAYEYTYEGVTYPGWRVSQMGRSLPESYTERYPVGATLDVWVKPGQPEYAVLEPGVYWMDPLVFLLVLGLCVASGIWLVSHMLTVYERRWLTVR